MTIMGWVGLRGFGGKNNKNKFSEFLLLFFFKNIFLGN